MVCFFVKGPRQIYDLTLGSTSLDEENVSVLNHVVLALGHHLALGLDFRFIAELLEGVEVVDDGLDKGLLKVGVNDTGGLRSLGARHANGPLTDLVGAGGEEAAKLQRLAHLGNQLG